jgi:hypothetical protein
MSEERPTLDAKQLREELEQEILAMGLHLAGSGRGLPSALLPALARLDANERPPIDELAAAHAVLCELVHPARPRTLALLSRLDASSRGRSTFSGVPITRNIMIVALTSLVGMVLVGMSPDVSSDPVAGNPTMSSGIPFLVNQLLFMFIAALGGAFHGISTLNRHIADGTYDPRYDASYWTRLVLGVISGMILSSLLEVPAGSNVHEVGRHVLALVGGFSAGLVHRILDRMVSSIESIFGADPRPGSDAPRTAEPWSSRLSAARTELGDGRSEARAAEMVPAPGPVPAPVPTPAPPVPR